MLFMLLMRFLLVIIGLFERHGIDLGPLVTLTPVNAQEAVEIALVGDDFIANGSRAFVGLFSQSGSDVWLEAEHS